MTRINMGKIAHFLSLVLVILLLWGSKGFLISHPLISASILLLFSILYFVIGLTLDSRFFIYPSIGLFVLAYFLSAYHLHPYPYHAPLVSTILVGLFLILALKNNIRPLLYNPFINYLYGLITFFTIYIIANANHYILTDHMVPIITFFSFSFALGLYCLTSKKQSLRYWTLFNVSLAFLFLLYAITPIPKEHYSLYLMVFFVCIMHLGTLVHRKTNFKEGKAFYWTGFWGLAIAPLYSVHQSNILLLLQALYALHFWEIHHEIKTLEPDCQKKGRICKIFKMMVYPLTIISLALIVQQHFPVSWNTIGTCLIFAFLYFKIAHDHRDSWEKKDLTLVITGTIFFTIAYFTAIFLYLSPDHNPWVWLASAPLIWILLFMGWIFSKGDNKIGLAINQTQYLAMAIALTIPFFLKRTDITVLLVLDLVFLLTYLLMYLKNRWWGFLYAFPMTISYLYYLMLHEAFIPTKLISPAFIFPGIIAVSMALWFYSKRSKWNEIFFFWLYTLSFMALITLNSSHVSMGYSLALWGVLYLFISLFGNLPSKELRSYFLTIGNTLSIASAVSIPFFMNTQATLHVYLLLGISYLIIYLIKKKEIYLYPIAISGSVSYYLFFLKDLRWDLICLNAVPFLVSIYGLWILMNRKHKKDSGIALKRIGHITAFFYTLMLVFNLSKTSISITMLSLVIYAGIYFLLNIFHKVYDIRFLAIGFISLIYFETLNISNSMTLEIHLQLFILIMVPLVLFGYYFWKQKDESWALPILDTMVIISLITTLVSLSKGFVWTTQVILIMSAVLFMAVSLFLKKDLYIFLTTLCLGLSAYNSLLAAKNRFVIDLVVYTVYALVFIGIFFFLPILRRIFNYRGPRYMIRAINWKSVLFYGSIGTVATFIFLFLYSLQLANFPGFCTKCHFMKPYAEAWEHSTHNEVNCVDCHYEPGIKPVIEGKINGLVSVVKYLTHTYSIKPNSEIGDASCLRIGCHNKMDLHAEILYKKNIYFNHEHHLKTLRRGKQLRCTTCHSQIVQGDHINVTESICFTCHFKERDKKGVGIGKCTICHDNPSEPVLYHGVEFNHKEFLENKPNELCIDCHSGVTQGDGEVPMERCFSCHTEQDPDLSDPETLHFVHITKRKIECFECHQDIKHGVKAMAKQIKWNCNECHESSHTVAEKMYLGIGAKGVSGEPDPMFTARVSCKGCHKYREIVNIGGLSFEATKANVKACDDCHGEGSGYTDLALEWQEDIKQMLEKVLLLRKELEKPIKLLKDKGVSSQSEHIFSIYEKAENNLLFIQADGSHGVHNYLFSRDLLEDIENDFDKCLSLIEKVGGFNED